LTVTERSKRRATSPPEQEQLARQGEVTTYAVQERRAGARVTRLAVGTAHREHRQRGGGRATRGCRRCQDIGAGRRAWRTRWCGCQGPTGDHPSDSPMALFSGKEIAAPRIPPALGGAPQGRAVARVRPQASPFPAGQLLISPLLVPGSRLPALALSPLPGRVRRWLPLQPTSHQRAALVCRALPPTAASLLSPFVAGASAPWVASFMYDLLITKL